MPFKHPHVSLISYSLEIAPEGIVEMAIMETDLHLNPRHRDYDAANVQKLIQAAQTYLSASGQAVRLRLVSTRSGEI